MRSLFSDEIFFDIDGVYSSHKRSSSRPDVDKKGGIKQRGKFPWKVMVWLGGSSKDVTPLLIFEEGTVDHTVYIKKVLPPCIKIWE